MWKEVILSPKGQITLPKEMRESLELEVGDTIVVTAANDLLVLTPKNVNFNDLAGFLGTPPLGPASLEEIEKTIAKEMADSAASSLSVDKNAAA